MREQIIVKRNKAVLAYEKILRHVLVNNFSKIMPLYIVTEHPKSGGSWFAQMLSDYLEIPFPRNSVPGIRASVMHGHYLYSKNYHNTFVVIRDGRDVMVSWYFHCYNKNDRFNERLVDRIKKARPFKDYDDVEYNLSYFIEFLFETKEPLGFTWVDFVNSWMAQESHFVKYEALLDNAVLEVSRVIEGVLNLDVDQERLKKIVNKYAFRKQSAGRVEGDEVKNSFLRKGISGDWKNYFNNEASKLFDDYAGKELIELGYVKNHEWVNS